ncbi:MAG: nucleotidyltransferase domain-containing protein [Dysgonamonadaceae bacterium]|jgi:predicted nucleotidyltransferase|nr:nucleotidyltransferase domain-containing protein [Dysgonamonadaceae bacterium]
MNQQILEDIRQLKRQLIPNERLILFGSQVRGDAKPDSDWDLLLVVNSGSTSLDDEIKYSYPFTKLGWKYNIDLNVLLYSEKDWEKRNFTPFYKNVLTEGIEIG